MSHAITNNYFSNNQFAIQSIISFMPKNDSTVLVCFKNSASNEPIRQMFFFSSEINVITGRDFGNLDIE